MEVSISLFGQSKLKDSTMADWISSFTQCVDHSLIDTIWFPERHGDRLGPEHSQPLINMAFTIGRLANTPINVGAGSLIPGLHGAQEVIDQIDQVSSLHHSETRIALGLGWDPLQFTRYAKDFELREQKFADFISLADTLSQYQSTRNLLRTISSDNRKWVSTGRAGLGVYTGAFGKSMSQLEGQILDYRRANINSSHRKDSGWVTCMTHAYVGRDDESASRDYRYIMNPYLESHGTNAGISLAERRKLADSSLNRMIQSIGLIGSPKTVNERLEKYKSIGVDELVVLYQYSSSLDDEIEQFQSLQEVLRNAI